MNPPRPRLTVAFAAALAFCPIILAQGARGGGGNGPTTVLGTPGLAAAPVDLYSWGAGRPKPVLSDLELTAITRMDEQVEQQFAAAVSAREALFQASFASPRNDADVRNKADALGRAEQALSAARADAFAALKSSLKLNDAQLRFVIQQVASGNLASSGTIFGQGAGAPRGLDPASIPTSGGRSGN